MFEQPRINYGAEANKKRRAAIVEAIKETAQREIMPLTEKEFCVAGLMLYWAEGAKRGYVDFANSDPAVIRFMMKWFRTICRVDERRFRFQLHLHASQNEREMQVFWSQLTGISTEQFQKSYIKNEGTGHRKNRLYYGTLKIRVCDKDLLYKILGWIGGVKKQCWAASSVGRAADSIEGPAHREVGMQTG